MRKKINEDGVRYRLDAGAGSYEARHAGETAAVIEAQRYVETRLASSPDDIRVVIRDENDEVVCFTVIGHKADRVVTTTRGEG